MLTTNGEGRRADAAIFGLRLHRRPHHFLAIQTHVIHPISERVIPAKWVFCGIPHRSAGKGVSSQDWRVMAVGSRGHEACQCTCSATVRDDHAELPVALASVLEGSRTWIGISAQEQEWLRASHRERRRAAIQSLNHRSHSEPIRAWVSTPAKPCIVKRRAFRTGRPRKTR